MTNERHVASPSDRRKTTAVCENEQAPLASSPRLPANSLDPSPTEATEAVDLDTEWINDPTAWLVDEYDAKETS